MTTDGEGSWADIARKWWFDLQPSEDGRWKPSANPGALARLRRGSTPLECLAEEPTLQLARRLGAKDAASPLLEPAAILAHVLAHVSSDAPGKTLGAALGGAGDDAPVMSTLRLRRLVGARDAEETMRGFREAVLLLGGSAPVRDLARLILDWGDPRRGPQSRTRLLFDWHDAGSAAPRTTIDA
jgi:CRISPR type I-E-associated protein CasB/Cse2